MANILSVDASVNAATSNISILFTDINLVNANVTAANSAIGSVTTAWTANAATQAILISTINANVTAANSAIVIANSAVVSYMNSQITTLHKHIQ